MLGLSATPYRLDGSNKLIELFFGANQVFKKLSRDYTVNVIYTPFQFKMEKTERGTINWGAILNQQAVCEERNDLIADIICTNKSIKFLVLCKRVDQIKELSQKCRERGIAVQAVYQDIAPQKDSRTLIGSIQKLGTGFSDNTFRGLIIAADVQDYFIQYFGRVLRAPDTCPAIYDLIDDNQIMRQHFAERRAIYESSGGTLKTVRASSLKRATM
jgi:superfamily II DNA or RNA helicase